MKPFKTITKIILPPQTNASQAVDVGPTNKLGLPFPVGIAAVKQQARKAAGALTNPYVGEAPGSLNHVYSWIDVGALVTGESFEWTILACE